MKQILLNINDGSIELVDSPAPAVGHGELLIRTSRTLVSLGTERMLLQFGSASWLERARQQPDKVRMVLQKIKTDGLLPTVQAVKNRLDQPLALGYCNVGKVEKVGAGVAGWQPGDRVASNGRHAEFVSVPKNLCVKIPNFVSDDDAVFTPVAAIALQGIRLVAPTLGESVAVIGLGLIGLITVQLLRAHGCRVLAVDVSAEKLERARAFGAKTIDLSRDGDAIAAARIFSRERGMDAVLIAASTASSDPIHQAAAMSRKRGRIVLVGVTGMEFSRADFYEKELSFQVSCSYGPGRYDSEYEQKGHDYPSGFVRWTEQRNFEAVLDMMASGAIDVRSLISHRFSIDDAHRAYALVNQSTSALGILLEYAVTEQPRSVVYPAPSAREVHGANAAPGVSIIGAGNYAASILIPAFKAAGAVLRGIASNSGVTALYAARKYGFDLATTDTEKLLADPQTNAVVIATRHDSHGELVLRALRAGKHVFVEKPLCITQAELSDIDEALRSTQASGRSQQHIMVGFNRRFAPLVVRMREMLKGVAGPKSFVCTVNAGAIPANHWTQDPQVGGGRIIGEACHFIDLLRFLADSTIQTSDVRYMTTPTRDTASIQLVFADGSVGTVHYFANGNRGFPKERLEVFADGRILQLDNFRRLVGYGWSRFRRTTLWRQDKGQRECVRTFVEALRRNEPTPIEYEQIREIAHISIALAQR